MTTEMSQHIRLLEVLEHLETIRNWLHEAPIDELEAVEKALGCNAPITETSEAIALLVVLAAELYDPTTEADRTAERVRATSYQG